MSICLYSIFIEQAFVYDVKSRVFYRKGWPCSVLNCEHIILYNEDHIVQPMLFLQTCKTNHDNCVPLMSRWFQFGCSPAVFSPLFHWFDYLVAAAVFPICLIGSI